jgi:hypothetical protein
MSVAAGSPTVHQVRVVPRRQQVEQSGNRHSRPGRDERQPAAVPGAQPAVEELALDLQPHEKKEDRHEAVVDPQVRRHRPELRSEFGAELGMQHIVVEVRERAVRHDERERRRDHQKHAAGRFAPHECA